MFMSIFRCTLRPRLLHDEPRRYIILLLLLLIIIIITSNWWMGDNNNNNSIPRLWMISWSLRPVIKTSQIISYHIISCMCIYI